MSKTRKTVAVQTAQNINSNWRNCSYCDYCQCFKGWQQVPSDNGQY